MRRAIRKRKFDIRPLVRVMLRVKKQVRQVHGLSDYFPEYGYGDFLPAQQASSRKILISDVASLTQSIDPNVHLQ